MGNKEQFLIPVIKPKSVEDIYPDLYKNPQMVVNQQISNINDIMEVFNRAKAIYEKKKVEEIDKLTKQIDMPTPQDVDEKAFDINMYMPNNPNFFTNVINAVSSWFGGQPQHPVWEPNYIDRINKTINKEAEETYQAKEIAWKKPEQRTPEELAYLSEWLNDNYNKNKLNNLKIVLSSMPENYNKISPNLKMEQIAKLKEDFENQKIKDKTVNEIIKEYNTQKAEERGGIVGLIEKGAISSENPEVKSLLNTAEQVVEPVQAGVEKVIKGVNQLTGTNGNKDVVGAALNLVAGVLETGVGALSSPLNLFIGAAKNSKFPELGKGIERFTQTVFSLPPAGIEYIAENLGVEDKEKLQNIGSIGTNVLLLGLGKFVKDKFTKYKGAVGEEAAKSYVLNDVKNVFENAQKLTGDYSKIDISKMEERLNILRKEIDTKLADKSIPHEEISKLINEYKELKVKYEEALKNSPIEVEAEKILPSKELPESQVEIIKALPESKIDEIKIIEDINTRQAELSNQIETIRDLYQKEIKNQNPEKSGELFKQMMDKINEYQRLDKQKFELIENKKVKEQIEMPEEGIKAEAPKEETVNAPEGIKAEAPKEETRKVQSNLEEYTKLNNEIDEYTKTGKVEINTIKQKLDESKSIRDNIEKESIKNNPKEPEQSQVINVNAKTIKLNDRFFDKEGTFWEVIDVLEDGSFIAKDGFDGEGNIKVRNFKGNIEIKGKNSLETYAYGGLAYDEKIAEIQNRIRKEKGLKPKIEENQEILEHPISKTLRERDITKFKATKTFIERTSEIIKFLTRPYKELNYKDPNQMIVSRYLNIIKNRIPDYARRQTVNHLSIIESQLKDNQYAKEIFRNKLIVDDLLASIEKGKYSIENIPNEVNKTLPFKIEDVYDLKYYSRILDAEIEKNPSVKQALKDRNELLNRLKIDAVREGLLNEDVLFDDRYFHRKILDIVDLEKAENVLANPYSQKKSSYRYKREGSDLDYTTNYLISEGEVVYQLLKDIENRRYLNKILEYTDKSKEVKEIAEATGKSISDIILSRYPDHVILEPKGFFRYHLTDKDLVSQMISGYRETSNRPIVPKEVAEALYEFGKQREYNIVERGLNTINSAFKFNVLFMPNRIAKYFLNNTTGDIDIALNYPGIVLGKKGLSNHFIKSINENYNYIFKKQPSKDILEFEQYGGISINITTTEMPEFKTSEFYGLITGKLNPINYLSKYNEGVKALNSFRENITRLAAYKYFKEQLQKGKKLYGASNKNFIDNLKTIEEKAAFLANDLLGDYSNISQFGQYARKFLIPFYSWLEINAPRYIKLMKNQFSESIAKGTISTIPVFTRAVLGYGKLLATMNAFNFLVQLWNATYYPEETKRLYMETGSKANFIFGKGPNGEIKAIRIQGALTDALDWFGLSKQLNEFIMKNLGILVQTKSFQENVKETFKAPINRIWNSALPIPRLIYDLVNKSTTYPDVFEPRGIPDPMFTFFKNLCWENVYRYIADLPRKGIVEDFLLNLISYSQDPGEIAYNIIREDALDFLNRTSNINLDKKAATTNLDLYYYKQALKFGDKVRAEKFKQRYFQNGGTEKGLKQSEKAMAPIYLLPNKYRKMYIEEVKRDPYKKELYNQAVEWYVKTYLKR